MLLQILSTHLWMSQRTHFRGSSKRDSQYPGPTVWRLERQLYGLRDSPKQWQIRLTQVHQNGSFTDATRSVCFHRLRFVKQCQPHCHGICRQPCCLRRVIISAEILPGGSESLQSQAHWLSHNRSLSEVLGQIHQEAQVRSDHNGVFLQKFVSSLLGLFDIISRVATYGVKIQGL